MQIAIERKRLLVREPLRPPDAIARCLLVTPAIGALLDGNSQYGVFPQIETERLVGRFVAGHLLTVSRSRTDKRPDLERIEGQDEVWALCPRKPPPGWRLLGRFAAPSCLLLLRAWEKRRLFPRYHDACLEVIGDWNKILTNIPPFRASSIEEYLGGVLRNADEKD